MLFNIVLVCIAGFIAAVVDAIAGGGGIISVPAFLIAGIPPHMTLGTNKFCATCGSLTSSINFFEYKKTNFSLLKYLIPFTFIGAILGANTVMKLDPKYLNGIVLALLIFVGIYSLLSRDLGKEDNFQGLNKKNLTLGIILSFSLGFYDGFFGPGVGSFLLFGLIGIFKFDFTKASGNGKILNFVSNITSLVLFAVNGQVNYLYGIPAALSMIIGARFGSKLAIKKGSKLIKPIFITMSLLMAVKMLYKITI
ncbi:hypothetical protein CLOACE_10720 [Clostridium acetireducens DSM 10703]|uniref:Probable membrane transporter protein n=1 Tax=Clostridium acetireducens DSM 10703 TaxID=1121290 RepID=A0A1E8EZ80_9CLOT|nr:TSUP family transporter [Clostridium acetireducens]OFI06299.1 hypothetical protein CLOACE_10720 [Clostridium acetireducens DSM 10703]